jgi:hypothetical protein
MKRPLRVLIWIIAIPSVFLLGSCNLAKINNDREKVAMWMDETTAFGIGRFILTRPNDFIVKSQRYKYNGNEIKTLTSKELFEYDHVVSKREKYLRENKRTDPSEKFRITELPWLEDARSPKKDTRLLIFREFEGQEMSSIYDIEGYAYLGDTMFSWTFSANPETLPLAIAGITKFTQSIKPRVNSDIPSESGFCFDGGIVETKKGKAVEWSKAYFERPDTPGAAIFGVEMRPRLESDDKLLDRVPTLIRILANLATHTRTLRSGNREVAGMPGEELLIRVKANEVTAYHFIWEYQGRDDDNNGPISLTYPNTRFELRVGGGKTGENATSETSVLTEQEALALWDALLAGFTFRPGAV